MAQVKVIGIISVYIFNNNYNPDFMLLLHNICFVSRIELLIPRYEYYPISKLLTKYSGVMSIYIQGIKAITK